VSPRVYIYRHNDAPADAVYIGRAAPRYGLRASTWANPFKVAVHGDRNQVIELYRRHLYDNGLIADIGELTGRDLLCWCAPRRCHGDVLLELANGKAATRE
jgi:Domain of unknown function (DUF4326)